MMVVDYYICWMLMRHLKAHKQLSVRLDNNSLRSVSDIMNDTSAVYLRASPSVTTQNMHCHAIVHKV